MPRAALSKVSLKQLVAEIDRRRTKLASLIAERLGLDAQIAELEVLVGQPSPAASEPAPQNRKVARRGKQRATGKPLAEYVQQVLAKAVNGLTIAEIEAKVRDAGYPTVAKKLYNPIHALVSKGYKKVGNGIYALKGTPAAPKAAAKAKKGKKTFSCPTCKKVFASGIMVGEHYKAEPSHRVKK